MYTQNSQGEKDIKLEFLSSNSDFCSLELWNKKSKWAFIPWQKQSEELGLAFNLLSWMLTQKHQCIYFINKTAFSDRSEWSRAEGSVQLNTKLTSVNPLCRCSLTFPWLLESELSCRRCCWILFHHLTTVTCSHTFIILPCANLNHKGQILTNNIKFCL